MLPELIGYRLRIAQIGIFDCTSMDGRDHHPVRRAGVDRCQSGHKQTQLADAINFDRSSVVSVLDKLGHAAWSSACLHRTTGAPTPCILTATGKRLLRLIPQVRTHEERVLQDLDPAERVQLRKLLGRLLLARG